MYRSGRTLGLALALSAAVLCSRGAMAQTGNKSRLLLDLKIGGLPVVDQGKGQSFAGRYPAASAVCGPENGTRSSGEMSK